MGIVLYALMAYGLTAVLSLLVVATVATGGHQQADL